MDKSTCTHTYLHVHIHCNKVGLWQIKLNVDLCTSRARAAQPARSIVTLQFSICLTVRLSQSGGGLGMINDGQLERMVGSSWLVCSHYRCERKPCDTTRGTALFVQTHITKEPQ